MADESGSKDQGCLRAQDMWGALVKLSGFARRVMENWPTGDVDGGELQEAAIDFGLLEPVEVTEPCGECCNCAEYHGEFPATCYRPTWLLEFEDPDPYEE